MKKVFFLQNEFVFSRLMGLGRTLYNTSVELKVVSGRGMDLNLLILALTWGLCHKALWLPYLRMRNQITVVASLWI